MAGAFLRIPIEGIVGAAVLLVAARPGAAGGGGAARPGPGRAGLPQGDQPGLPVRAGPAVRPGAGLAAAEGRLQLPGRDRRPGVRDDGPGRLGGGHRGRVRRAGPRGGAAGRSGRPASPRGEAGGARADRGLGRAGAGRDARCSRTRRSPRTAPCGWPRRTLVNVPRSLADQKAFAAAAAHDPWRDVPARRLLTGLRGKDVVFGVVESYGRSALDNPKMARTASPALDASDAELTGAGFHARSAYLTSSTYGGGSWLAHATFQSGLWIDHQQPVPPAHRGRPADADQGLPEGRLAHRRHRAGQHARLAGGRLLRLRRRSTTRATSATAGPRFGWSRMPDQYTLSGSSSTVYGRPDRGPLMAELTLTSSHTPWAPIPQMVDWDAVGDGSVFDPIAAAGKPRERRLEVDRQGTHRVRQVGRLLGRRLTSWAATGTATTTWSWSSSATTRPRRR